MADDPPPGAEQLRELALALHDVSWRIARFGPAQAGVDPLPASELAVLRTVMDHPDRPMSEVAQTLSMQPSNVSAAVRNLLERGLVEKHPHPHDRRVSLLSPTRKALRNRDRIEETIAATVSAALGAIPAEHAEALTGALPALRALAAALGSQTWRL
ncbi:MarR family winged helix-turn-helix transcriptional regulator [Mycolicibacterium parafortuitum]|uniref:MarR family transcriptional regulator [Thermomonospora curvata DSM] n=1 Tax=Mycolicibacterium parafortuitum TaxID=39692 RepID=A0A375YKQ6_MYCPF|nr:MarR family winged helix-turn-helix transcriptional regulator [Mycolicibacterium parafortuitum]ORB25586.1 MarR family transcriptional regulator [Mycolicibacterium parafortuitum]SRX81725.1 MarR family transcriptional regulator [Thermomonospora curvata DSM] [Mycolicibacterium parafortuitum]